MGLPVITDRSTSALFNRELCSILPVFFAVYRLVDGWQEIREYQQLTPRREPFFTTEDDVQSEEDRRKKQQLQGKYATMR